MMAKQLPLDPEYCPDLYDSATGQSLTATSVFDITDDCPSHDRTILLFTKAKRGRIVQIANPYPKEKYMGMRTHFFVDELNDPIRSCDDTFARCAHFAGLSRIDLQKLVESLAP